MLLSTHNRSDRGEKVRFFRLPAVISHQTVMKLWQAE